MPDLIVSHLRRMWEEHLADEWARVEPMLQDAVAAFGQVDLSKMDRREAVKGVTGKALKGKSGTGSLRRWSGLYWISLGNPLMAWDCQPTSC